MATTFGATRGGVADQVYRNSGVLVSVPEETKIAEILVQSGVITIDQLKKTVEFRDSLGGGSIRGLVIKLGYAKEADVVRVLAARAEVASVEISPGMIDYESMKKVPQKVFDNHNVVILRSKSGRLKLAMADTNNLAAIEEVQFLTDKSVEPVVASKEAINRALKNFEKHGGSPPVAHEAEATSLAAELQKLPTDLLLRAFVLSMIEREQLTIEELKANAAKIEQG
jgi:hypothetical protein